MLAVRRRAGGLARQLRRPARRLASDSHVHQTPDPANESFGIGSIATFGAFFGFVLVYQLVPSDGEQSALKNWIGKLASRPEDWEETNAIHTKAMLQAGFDRNLFENASSNHRHVDVSFPEALQSHAQRNIPAGHLMNIDHVVEHYRQLHLKDEERKAKSLAQKERQR